jgi:hypothetical protein
MNGSNIFLIIFSTLVFLAGGVRDMKRRAFILNQLGQYLSPKKLERYKNKKLLPTINILDQVSLRTWLDLRKLSIDYGNKYFFRHEIFMHVVFGLGVICLFALFLIVSKIVDMGDSEDTKKELTKLTIGLTSGSLYFMVISFYMLYQAAFINEQFEVHKEIMKNNQELLEDILMFKEFYFAKQLNPHLIPPKQD